MSKSDEIAELKARIETLERATKPEPPRPPWQPTRFDPTANMTLPESAINAMTAAICLRHSSLAFRREARQSQP
jgi:hypothetical protein